METDALKKELADEVVVAKYAHTTKHGSFNNMHFLHVNGVKF
jgi:hypothetical protein